MEIFLDLLTRQVENYLRGQYDGAMALKILLVEDEPDIAELIQSWLKELGSGVEIQHCVTGEEALESLHTFTPDLILLDLRLPGLDGIEVLKKIKNEPKWRNIEVIVNSVSENPEHLSKTYRYGACLFVRKSGDSKVLLEAIRHLMAMGRIHSLK
jgi:CheY-like chemotaxis protein